MKTKLNILEEMIEKYSLPSQYVDDILFYATRDRDIYQLFMQWCAGETEAYKEDVIVSIYEHIEKYK